MVMEISTRKHKPTRTIETIVDALSRIKKAKSALKLIIGRIAQMAYPTNDTFQLVDWIVHSQPTA